MSARVRPAVAVAPGAASPVGAEPSDRQRRAPFDAGEALRMLFSKARRQLDAADLAWLAEGCATQARLAARRGAELAAGIGCLVAHDAGQDTPGAGSFQNGADVAELLFHLADHFSQVGGLLDVAEGAAQATQGGAA